jgi:hypothetical protein
MNIVLDTNVLINALQDRNSYAMKILDLAKKSDISFFASPKVLKEYELIISREVKNEKDEQELMVFLSKVKVENPSVSVSVVKYDPEDDKFINIAISANAKYIISNDSHLLEIMEYEGIKIVKPDEFLYIWQDENDKDGSMEWGNIFSELFK